MSVIMTLGSRRCDGTCHHAKGIKCGCICGGRYHGASVRRDMTVARAEMEELILKVTQKSLPCHESKYQLGMFEESTFELTEES